MTCSTIVSPTNFPSEFSTSGKRHNISLKDNSNELSQISSNDETSLNNNIMCPFAFGSQINKFAPSDSK